MPKPLFESSERTSAASSTCEGDEHRPADVAKTASISESVAAARAEIFSVLDKEMELADYATNEKTGCKVRRMPRKERVIRAAKRRALEREDDIRLGFRAKDDGEDGNDDEGFNEESETEDAQNRITGVNVDYQHENNYRETDSMGIENSYENYNNEAGVADDDNELMEEVVGLGADYLNLNDDDNDDEDENDFDENDDEIIDDDDEGQDEEEGGSDSDDLNDGYDEDDNLQSKNNAKASTGLETDKAKGKNSQRRNQPTTSDKSTTINEKKRKYTYRVRRPTNKSRTAHRLKDFSSSKLAQRHGEAIGAHIIGMSETAVKRLRGVAKVAPGAPQVYSSLGLVYDSMLREVEEKLEKLESYDVDDENSENSVTKNAVTNTANIGNINEKNSDTDGEEIIVGEIGDDSEKEKKVVNPYLDLLQQRMELARKAYGSYHVAALLCKRDYSLWERSGDVASKIANIYFDAIKYVEKHPAPPSGESQDEESVDVTNNVASKSKKFNPHSAGIDELKSERISWIEHTRNAYESADLLRPNGAEIPCKLAQAHMMLENYLEAYTILTKLEDDSKGNGLMESYSCYLLYADLMVRIGYECQIWNDGTSHNRAYMFKRWLRKHSRTFNWKERRLQALCCALELAAGTKSCMKLIVWMEKRREEFERNDNDDGMGVDTGADEDADTSTAETAVGEVHEGEDNAGQVKSDASNTTAFDKARAYEKERIELLIRNKVELNEFDKKSKEMNLVEGSHMHRNRVKAREALVEKHRDAIREMAQKTLANVQEAENLYSPHGKPAKKQVSAQGSCATVLDVAELILNQCVQCGLYECGALVVQCVLSYFRERIARHERRVVKQKEIEKSRHANNGIAQAGFRFDQINFDVEGSEDEDDNILSDDEELEDSNSTSGLLHLLRSGMLPTQLKAMFALCLLGMGGQDHVALNCLEKAIHSTELEPWSEENSASTNKYPTDERRWILFQESLLAPVNKLSLLASVADMIQNDVKSDFWIPRLLDIFRHFLKNFDKNHGVDKILSGRCEVTRNNAVKLLYAVTELIISNAKSNLVSSIETGTDEDKVAQQVVTDIVYAFKIIVRFEEVFWNPNESDWSLPNSSMKTLKLLSSALSALVQASSSGIADNLVQPIKDAIANSCHVMSIICRADSDTLDGLFGWTSSKDEYASETWESFPLASEWQLPFHKHISLKTFNLCVSSCVSSFSGWEPNEFHLDSLRSRDNGNIFGISVSGPSVAGFLSSHITDEIGCQWRLVNSILQNLECVEYERSLSRRMNAEWYQKVKDNLKKKGSEKNTIACFGEHDALRILLSFSNLCLIAAKHSEDDQKDGFMRLSMSVLLPLTQFSTDKRVWDSEIGTRVINDQNESRVRYYLDENSQWMGPTKQSDNRMPPSTRKRRQQKSQNMFVRQLKPSKIVRVSTSALLKEWSKGAPVREDCAASESAILSMKKLDDSMKNLTKSRTVCSLERASLDVATALIDVAAHDECQNPFICVQQAAIFASMAPKRGTNDEPFKKFLPVQTRCTPSEAIVILGRADCMRALHFLDESQFLCSWVAKECSLHRDGDDDELPWCSRWKAVGILAYIIASAIEETSIKLSCTDGKAGSIRQWGEAVEEEIGRGKADAIALIREYRCKETVEDYDTDESDGNNESVNEILTNSKGNLFYGALMQQLPPQNQLTTQNAMPSLPQPSQTPVMPSNNEKTNSSQSVEKENSTNVNTKKRSPKPVPLPNLPPYEEAIQHSEGLDVDDVEAVEVAPGQADVTAFLMEEINQHRIKSEDDDSDDDSEFSPPTLQTGRNNGSKSNTNYGDGLDGAINEALELDNIEVFGI